MAIIEKVTPELSQIFSSIFITKKLEGYSIESTPERVIIHLLLDGVILPVFVPDNQLARVVLLRSELNEMIAVNIDSHRRPRFPLSD